VLRPLALAADRRDWLSPPARQGTGRRGTDHSRGNAAERGGTEKGPIGDAGREGEGMIELGIEPGRGRRPCSLCRKDTDSGTGSESASRRPTRSPYRTLP